MLLLGSIKCERFKIEISMLPYIITATGKYHSEELSGQTRVQHRFDGRGTDWRAASYRPLIAERLFFRVETFPNVVGDSWEVYQDTWLAEFAWQPLKGLFSWHPLMPVKSQQLIWKSGTMHRRDLTWMIGYPSNSPNHEWLPMTHFTEND